MPYYTNRVLTRQFIDSSGFASGLANAVDATAITGQLGNPLYVTDGTNSLGFRYVKLATGVGTLVANAPMYWTDAAKRTVDSDPTKAKTYIATSDNSIESAAGLLLNAGASAVAGAGVWLQISGYLANIPCPASVVPGERLILSNAATTVPTINAFQRLAAGTGPATPEALTQLYVVAHTSVASSLTNGWVMGMCALP